MFSTERLRFIPPVVPSIGVGKGFGPLMCNQRLEAHFPRVIQPSRPVAVLSPGTWQLGTNSANCSGRKSRATPRSSKAARTRARHRSSLRRASLLRREVAPWPSLRSRHAKHHQPASHLPLRPDFERASDLLERFHAWWGHFRLQATVDFSLRKNRLGSKCSRTKELRNRCSSHFPRNATTFGPICPAHSFGARWPHPAIASICDCGMS